MSDDNKNFKWDDENDDSSNPFNQNQGGGPMSFQQMFPPHIREEIEEQIDERIRKRMKAVYQLEDDELKTLYPDRTALREAYEDFRKSKKFDVTKVEEDDEEPEDEFDLPEQQRKEIQIRLDKRKAARAKKEKKLEEQGSKMLEDAGLGDKKKKTTKGKKKKGKKIAPPTGKKTKAEDYKPPKTLQDILGEGFDLDSLDD